MKQEEENRRVTNIRRNIYTIKNLAVINIGLCTAEILDTINRTEEMVIDDKYGEFIEEANATKQSALSSLRLLYSNAKNLEDEQEKAIEAEAKLAEMMDSIAKVNKETIVLAEDKKTDRVENL